jgi:DNA-binding PadR family transcriptional regulator
MSIAAMIDDTDLDTESARELTAFQRNVLIVLAEGPSYGLGVKEQLEEYYDGDVNHGRLYPNLDRLVEMGLVRKGEIDKRTNEYELTDDGYAVIGDHLEWTLSKVLTDESRIEDVEALLEGRE